MPTCMPKKTRFALGTKCHPSDKVFDVRYLQGLLRSVEEGIKEEKLRVRELSASNVKLHNRWKKLRRDGDELYETMVELNRELRREKERTARLRYEANMSSAVQSLGQNCGGFQPLQGGHSRPYPAQSGNGAYWANPTSQAGPHYVEPRDFSYPIPTHYPMSHGDMAHFQPPPQPNYFHNQHTPQPGHQSHMGYPGAHQYPRWVGVPQYGY